MHQSAGPIITPGFYAAFYLGTRAGLPGLYNRGVRALEGGPYSHCELLFSNGDSCSASYMDGGVRFAGPTHARARLDFDNGNWELIALPAEIEAEALAYATSHSGWSYDLRGNLRFLWPWGNHDSKLKQFCSEFVLGALGVPESWQFGVNAAAAVCRRLGRNVY